MNSSTGENKPLMQLTKLTNVLQRVRHTVCLRETIPLDAHYSMFYPSSLSMEAHKQSRYPFFLLIENGEKKLVGRSGCYHFKPPFPRHLKYIQHEYISDEHFWIFIFFNNPLAISSHSFFVTLRSSAFTPVLGTPADNSFLCFNLQSLLILD